MYTMAELIQDKKCEHIRAVAKLLAEHSRLDALRFIRNNLKSGSLRQANECLKLLSE